MAEAQYRLGVTFLSPGAGQPRVEVLCCATPRQHHRCRRPTTTLGLQVQKDPESGRYRYRPVGEAEDQEADSGEAQGRRRKNLSAEVAASHRCPNPGPSGGRSKCVCMAGEQSHG